MLWSFWAISTCLTLPKTTFDNKIWNTNGLVYKTCTSWSATHIPSSAVCLLRSSKLRQFFPSLYVRVPSLQADQPVDVNPKTLGKNSTAEFLDSMKKTGDVQTLGGSSEKLKVCIFSADFWGLKSAGGTATAYHLLAAVLGKVDSLEVNTSAWIVLRRMFPQDLGGTQIVLLPYTLSFDILIGWWKHAKDHSYRNCTGLEGFQTCTIYIGLVELVNHSGIEIAFV